MSADVLETPLSYEAERGKPIPSKNHGIVQTNLTIALSKAGVKSCWAVQPASRSITIYGPDNYEQTFLPGQTAVDPVLGLSAGVDAVFS